MKQPNNSNFFNGEPKFLGLQVPIYLFVSELDFQNLQNLFQNLQNLGLEAFGYCLFRKFCIPLPQKPK